MIELLPIAGMIFSLLLALIVGGFVLVFPLTRRLGKLLEIRMEERRQELEREGRGTIPPGELRALRDSLEALQGEVAVLADRQQFVESLLEGEERRGLPAGGAGAAPAAPAGSSSASSASSASSPRTGGAT